uniref:Uncharacterized protein n=1 Tax=Oryza rufipogon TaxID=4529 RepID=A0A0E0MUV3_ORYRU
MFNVVPGLDGKPGSVSLELGSKPGCFLVAGASTKVQVGCRSRGSDGEDDSSPRGPLVAGVVDNGGDGWEWRRKSGCDDERERRRN